MASTTLYSLLATVLILSILSAPATALRQSRFELRRPQLQARFDEIMVDASPPDRPLHPRQLDIESTASRPPASDKTSISPSPSTSASASATASETTTSIGSSTTGLATAPAISASPLPRAFDGGIGTNYTQPACPTFLKEMIRNDIFASCLPISILLQNSVSFFTASRSAGTLDPVLSAACHINRPDCSAIISSYALALRSNAGCAEDYNRQNPVVRQAYNGLLAYDVVYRATCLPAQPSESGNRSSEYCYTNAVTNLSSPTDAYVYYLALGVDLPGGSMPTCSPCLKETMESFATAAPNRTQPISWTYRDAAQMISLQCGPNFLNQSVTASANVKSAATTLPSSAWVGTTSIAVLISILSILADAF
ncbi:MAG: hypothetical protein Q9163_006386 [Psora crenata]